MASELFQTDVEKEMKLRNLRIKLFMDHTNATSIREKNLIGRKLKRLAKELSQLTPDPIFK